MMRRISTCVPAAWKHGARRVLALPVRRDLDRLARLYRTDKASDKHAYTRIYLRHLNSRRSVTAVLEIGIGGTTSADGYETSHGGASLRMWQDYFPKAKIVGLDLHHKDVRGRRIFTEEGSQDDVQVLNALAAKHGPFDLIIDDGSHIGRHQRASLLALWPWLRSGGLYVIEDLATAYDANYEGGEPGTDGTAVALVKESLDWVLGAHWQRTNDTAMKLAAVHLYDEIAILEKA